MFVRLPIRYVLTNFVVPRAVSDPSLGELRMRYSRCQIPFTHLPYLGRSLRGPFRS